MRLPSSNDLSLFFRTGVSSLLQATRLMDYSTCVRVVGDLVAAAPIPVPTDRLRRPRVPMVDVPLNVCRKRYGVYFAQSPIDLNPDNWKNFDAKTMNDADENDDNGSSWEFRCDGRRTSTTIGVRRMEMGTSLTPAQEIAVRYRSGCISLAGDDSLLSLPESEDTTDAASDISDECASEIDADTYPVEDAKIRFRQSRADVMDLFEAEARVEMRRSGATESDPLVCPRRGCRDTLSNMIALKFHLHLHGILDHINFVCDACEAGFETRHAFNAHHCPARSRSAPSSPLLETFSRAMCKLSVRT